MKNSKFYVLILIIFFSIPSIVSAAWWNPLTWSIFNKPPAVQQIIIPSTPKAEEPAQIQTVKPVRPEKNKEIIKTAPTPTKQEVATSSQEQIVITPPKNQRTCNGAVYTNDCPKNTAFNCPKNGNKPYCESIIDPEPTTQTPYIAKQKTTSKLDSPECLTARAKADELGDQIDSIQSKLAKDVEIIMSAPGISTIEQRNAEAASIRRESLSKQADIAVLQISALRAVNISCGLYQENPTAMCKDGTYSYGENRSGTCSWHGGVQYWIY